MRGLGFISQHFFFLFFFSVACTCRGVCNFQFLSFSFTPHLPLPHTVVQLSHLYLLECQRDVLFRCRRCYSTVQCKTAQYGMLTKKEGGVWADKNPQLFSTNVPKNDVIETDDVNTS